MSFEENTDQIIKQIKDFLNIMDQDNIDKLLKSLNKLEKINKSNLGLKTLFLYDDSKNQNISLYEVLNTYKQEIRKILGIKESRADILLKPLKNKSIKSEKAFSNIPDKGITIQEAYRSGKWFKRPHWSNWWIKRDGNLSAEIESDDGRTTALIEVLNSVDDIIMVVHIIKD